jgi:hypothetical protein
MTRDIKDIITDMREIVKPYVTQMLFNENFEGKGNTDKAEFETEFEMLLTLAERGASVEPQEWISVKKQGNPTMSDEYYVTVRHPSFNSVERAFYSFQQNKWEHSCASDIIAWREIEPSPYKGEEE